jgi:hypothetical protein
LYIHIFDVDMMPVLDSPPLAATTFVVVVVVVVVEAVAVAGVALAVVAVDATVAGVSVVVAGVAGEDPTIAADELVDALAAAAIVAAAASRSRGVINRLRPVPRLLLLVRDVRTLDVDFDVDVADDDAGVPIVPAPVSVVNLVKYCRNSLCSDGTK